MTMFEKLILVDTFVIKLRITGRRVLNNKPNPYGCIWMNCVEGFSGLNGATKYHHTNKFNHHTNNFHMF